MEVFIDYDTLTGLLLQETGMKSIEIDTTMIHRKVHRANAWPLSRWPFGNMSCWSMKVTKRCHPHDILDVFRFIKGCFGKIMKLIIARIARSTFLIIRIGESIFLDCRGSICN